MKDKPIIIVKLGDAEKGWIPSRDHFEKFMELAEDSGLTKKFNIMLFHYGINIQLLEIKSDLKNYGLEIIDESKFKDFIEINKPKI
jgi:hypothetical protein